MPAQPSASHPSSRPYRPHTLSLSPASSLAGPVSWDLGCDLTPGWRNVNTAGELSEGWWSRYTALTCDSCYTVFTLFHTKESSVQRHTLCTQLEWSQCSGVVCWWCVVTWGSILPGGGDGWLEEELLICPPPPPSLYQYFTHRLHLQLIYRSGVRVS